MDILQSSPLLTAKILSPVARKEMTEEQAETAAKDLVASFLSDCFQHLFKTAVTKEGLFGAGSQEEMFRSLWTEAIAKKVAEKERPLTSGIMTCLLKNQEISHESL